MATENEIKSAIKAHIDSEGGPYRTWYVGITNDIDARLFGNHGVSKENGWWIYRTATYYDERHQSDQIDLRQLGKGFSAT